MLSWFASLSFVNQAALWALLAIAVPVLIHLINPSKGKLVWVGNIELIKKAKQTRVNQFKIKRWLLLLIRLLIVISCCLLLADLWGSSIGQANRKFKLLITPAWLSNASEKDKHELIEKNNNAEFIVLDSNNSKIESATLFDNELSSTNFASELTYAELAEKSLALNLSPNNSALAITNNYSSSESPRALNSLFSQIYTKGTAAIATQDLLSILIVNDSERTDDGKIILKSFSVLPEEIKERIRVELVSHNQLNREPENAKYDVVFKLARKNIDVGRYIKQNGLLISDSNPDLSSKIGAAELFQINEQLFRFFVSQSNEQFTPIWRSSTANSILSYQKQQGIHQLHFASRFHPGWTNLVESQQFPIILVDLIQNYLSRKSWKIAASSFKAKEQSKTSELKSYGKPGHKESLYSWILLLLAFLWLIERVIAENISFQFKKENK